MTNVPGPSIATPYGALKNADVPTPSEKLDQPGKPARFETTPEESVNNLTTLVP